jgi:hypothetical protein
LCLDRDIYRAAKLLVDQHGEDAPIRAAERSDELLEKGDTEGAAPCRHHRALILNGTVHLEDGPDTAFLGGLPRLSPGGVLGSVSMAMAVRIDWSQPLRPGPDARLGSNYRPKALGRLALVGIFVSMRDWSSPKYLL